MMYENKRMNLKKYLHHGPVNPCAKNEKYHQQLCIFESTSVDLNHEGNHPHS